MKNFVSRRLEASKIKPKTVASKQKKEIIYLFIPSTPRNKLFNLLLNRQNT